MNSGQELSYEAILNSEKPKDLSKDSLGWARIDEDALKTEETHIFTNLQFKDLGLRGHLADVIRASKDNFGFELTTCTSVQSMVLPLFVSNVGGNVLIKSQTGSGKTLSYILPVMHDLLGITPPVQRSDGCMALIISPTRELCSQIAEVTSKLTRCAVNIVPGSISGGEKKKSEKARLRKGVNILVATPGRLLDHLKMTESFSLQKLRFVILDEVDRLLDMGFEQSILEILSRISGRILPGLKDNSIFANNRTGGMSNLQSKYSQQSSVKAKQTNSSLTYIMASATLNERVKTLAGSILLCPTHAVPKFTFVDGDNEQCSTIHSVEELNQVQHQVAAKPVSMVPSTLSQYYMLVHAKWRLPALLSFLYLNRHKKVLVFFSTCDAVDYHGLLFKHMQWPTGLDSKGGYIGDKEPANNSIKSKKAAPKYVGENPSQQEQNIDPLDSPFYGVLGKNAPIYRLHGQVPPEVRKKVYQAFTKSSKGIMFCTDVAARGLDLDHVDWILQYDAPCDTMDYVHRVGRTARKGEKGSAMLFLQPNEQMYIPFLSSSHGLCPQRISPQSMFQQVAPHIPQSQKFKNLDEMVSVILQRRAENTVYQNKYLVLAAVQAYRSAMRAYNTHTFDVKGIFRLKDLHLGHVSKSFGLREKPSEMQKGDEDVIEQIFVGNFMKRVSGGVNQGKEAEKSIEWTDVKERKSSSMKTLKEREKMNEKRGREEVESESESEDGNEKEESKETKKAKKSTREDFIEDAGYTTKNSSLDSSLVLKHKTAATDDSKSDAVATLKSAKRAIKIGSAKKRIPLLRASGKHRVAKDKQGKRSGYFRNKLRAEFAA